LFRYFNCSAAKPLNVTNIQPIDVVLFTKRRPPMGR
jgi:hypothetical protein